jgi:hypothetical protein
MTVHKRAVVSLRNLRISKKLTGVGVAPAFLVEDSRGDGGGLRPGSQILGATCDGVLPDLVAIVIEDETGIGGRSVPDIA